MLEKLQLVAGSDAADELAVDTRPLVATAGWSALIGLYISFLLMYVIALRMRFVIALCNEFSLINLLNNCFAGDEFLGVWSLALKRCVD